MGFSRQEWVAISFSRGSSQPRDRTRVSHTVGRRFTIWATREAWTSLETLKNPHSQRTVIFWWSVWHIPKPPFTGLAFTWPHSEHAQWEIFLPEATVKKNSQLFNMADAWDGNNIPGKETVKKNLQGITGRGDVLRKLWEALTNSWECTRSHTWARLCVCPRSITALMSHLWLTLRLCTSSSKEI